MAVFFHFSFSVFSFSTFCLDPPPLFVYVYICMWVGDPARCISALFFFSGTSAERDDGWRVPRACEWRRW